MLYNKRNIKIINDKKKLIKKGKHWLVASAFVLALLAGGSFQLTKPAHANMNQAQTSITAKTPAQHNNMQQSHSNSNASQISQQAQQVHANLLAKAPLKPTSTNSTMSQQTQQSQQMPMTNIPTSDYTITNRTDKGSNHVISVTLNNPGKFITYLSGNDGHQQHPQSTNNGNTVALTSDATFTYAPLHTQLTLSNQQNHVQNDVKLSTMPVNNQSGTNMVDYIKTHNTSGYQMLNSDFNLEAFPNTKAQQNANDVSASDYTLSMSLTKPLNVSVANQEAVSETKPSIYFESTKASPIQAVFVNDKDGESVVGQPQTIAQGYLGDYADVSQYTPVIPQGMKLVNGTGDPSDTAKVNNNKAPLTHIPFSPHAVAINYHVEPIAIYNYQPMFYAEEVNSDLTPTSNRELIPEYFPMQKNVDAETNGYTSDSTNALPLPATSDMYHIIGGSNISFNISYGMNSKVQYNNWVPSANTQIDSNGVNRGGYWSTLNSDTKNSVWNYKGVPVIPFSKIKGYGPQTKYLNANNIQYQIGLYAPKDIPFLHGWIQNSNGRLQGSFGVNSLKGTTNDETMWYFPKWSNEYKKYPNGYQGRIPESFVPAGTYLKIPLTPGQTHPGYFNETNNNGFDDSNELSTDGNNLYITFHDDKTPTYSLNGPSKVNDYSYGQDKQATMDGLFVHKMLPEFKYDVYFVDPNVNGQPHAISQNGSDMGLYNPDSNPATTVMATHAYNLYVALYDNGNKFSNGRTIGNPDFSDNRTDYIFYQLDDSNAEPFATIPTGYVPYNNPNSNKGNNVIDLPNQHIIEINVLPIPHKYTLGISHTVIGEDESVPLEIEQLDNNGQPTSVQYTIQSKPVYTNFTTPITFNEPNSLIKYATNNWKNYTLLSKFQYSTKQSEVIPMSNATGSNIRPIVWFYEPKKTRTQSYEPKVRVIDYAQGKEVRNDIIQLPTSPISGQDYTFNPSSTLIDGHHSLNDIEHKAGFTPSTQDSTYTWRANNNDNNNIIPVEKYYTEDGSLTVKYVIDGTQEQVGQRGPLRNTNDVPRISQNISSNNLNDYLIDRGFTTTLVPSGYQYKGIDKDAIQLDSKNQQITLYVTVPVTTVSPKDKDIPGQHIPNSPANVVWPTGVASNNLSRTYTRTFVPKDMKTNQQIGHTITQHVTFTRDAEVNTLTGNVIQYSPWYEDKQAGQLSLITPSNIPNYTYRKSTPDLNTLSLNPRNNIINNKLTDTIDLLYTANTTSQLDKISYTRTIYYMSKSLNGGNAFQIQTPMTQVVSYHRTQTHNDATGSDTYSQWQPSKLGRDWAEYTPTSDITFQNRHYIQPSIANISQINNPTFNDNIQIYYAPESSITVNYIDKATPNKTLRSVHISNIVNNPFDINPYLDKIPSGYEYAGINNDSSNDASNNGITNKDKNNDGKFDGTFFGKSDHTIDILLIKTPKPKVAKSTITVNDIDAGSGELIKKAGSDTENITTPFDVSKYLSIPNGYHYVGMRHNVSDFDYDNHTIDILLRKDSPSKVAQSTIKVNYLDKATNQIISSAKPDTENVSTPFDIGNYLNNLPKGYQYVNMHIVPNSDTDFNGTEFDYHNQTINIYLAKLPQGSIQVNYIDKSNHQLLAQAKAPTEEVGTPFDISNYLKENDMPTEYEYSGINGNMNYYEKGNHTINVLLIKRNSAKVAKSTITINYVDNKKVIASSKSTEPVSTDYDLGQHLSIPNGYEYKGIKNDTNDFHYDNQTIEVLINKVPTPQVAKSTITVNYVDAKSGQVIQKAGSDTEDITTPFDISEYLDKIPSDYEYAGIKNDVNSFDYDNHTVEVLLNKENPAKVAKSTITLNYKDGNKIVASSKDTEPVSTNYDAWSHMSIPAGYEYTGIQGSNVSDFKYSNQSITIDVRKVPKAKVAQSKIIVNYVNALTNKVMQKAGSDTENITTPFDISKYLSNLPAGYEYTGIKNNVTDFDYDNHTIDILVTPVTTKGNIIIRYINRATHQDVTAPQNMEAPVGTPFDTTQLLNNIPQGFVYDGMNGSNVYAFNSQTQYINILLDKDANKEVPLPKSLSSSITTPSKPSSANSANTSNASSVSSKPSSKAKSQSSNKSTIKPSSASSVNTNKASGTLIKPASRAKSQSSSEDIAHPSSNSRATTSVSNSVKPQSTNTSQSTKSTASIQSKSSTNSKAKASSQASTSSTAHTEPSSMSHQTNHEPNSVIAPTSSKSSSNSGSGSESYSTSTTPTQDLMSNKNTKSMATSVSSSKESNTSNDAYANTQPISLKLFKNMNNFNNKKGVQTQATSHKSHQKLSNTHQARKAQLKSTYKINKIIAKEPLLQNYRHELLRLVNNQHHDDKSKVISQEQKNKEQLLKNYMLRNHKLPSLITTSRIPFKATVKALSHNTLNKVYGYKASKVKPSNQKNKKLPQTNEQTNPVIISILLSIILNALGSAMVEYGAKKRN